MRMKSEVAQNIHILDVQTFGRNYVATVLSTTLVLYQAMYLLLSE
jgi:hypothetical protein